MPSDLVLVLLSILAILVGLVRPTFFRIKSRKNSSLIFGGLTILFFILFGVTSPNIPTVNNVSTSPTITPAPAVIPQTPLTDQQKVENAATSGLQQASLLSFKSAKIDSTNIDLSWPKGSQRVTISIDAGKTGSAEESISELDQLEIVGASIYSRVFSINPDFYAIVVDFNTKTLDNNGKLTVVSVPMTLLRPTFTEEQSIENIVKSAIQQSSMPLTYKFADIETSADDPAGIDPTWPKGSEAIQIYIDADQIGDATDFVTGVGKLASNIYKQIFPINKNFYSVYIDLTTKSVDQYGNASDDKIVMDFKMQRPLYEKINWPNFSQTQNDIHFCAFLQQQTDISNSGVKNNYCEALGSSDLMSAEKTIEAENPITY